MLRLKTIDFADNTNKEDFDREVAEFMESHNVVNYVLHEPYVMTIYYNTKQRILPKVVFKKHTPLTIAGGTSEEFDTKTFNRTIDRVSEGRNVQSIKFFPEIPYEPMHAVIYYAVGVDK